MPTPLAVEIFSDFGEGRGQIQDKRFVKVVPLRSTESIVLQKANLSIEPLATSKGWNKTQQQISFVNILVFEGFNAKTENSPRERIVPGSERAATQIRYPKRQ